MSQGTVVMAFRKRAKRWGYTDIQIYKYFRDGKWVPGMYLVEATGPLAGEHIRVVLDVSEMALRFKRGIPTSR